MARREPQDRPSAQVPVAIYTRVSTDNQVGGRFDSCESQAAVCRDYISKHSEEGWYEAAALTDAAYSGGTMDRPGIQTLKRMIQGGEVKVVLIFKLERVSRNMDEWGPFRAFLQKHECRLESATENISEIEPEGRLKNNIMMSVAEFERLNTAKKTRLKMREQAKRGYWNGGPVPYGYAYDKNTQSLYPHPVEAPVLRRIFEETAKLRSLTEIANDLNSEGHRTKERIMQRRDGTKETVGGRHFRSDGLRLIIRNPIYRGFVKFEGHEFTGKHEPLVLIKVWEQANAATEESLGQAKVIDAQASLQARDAHNHLFKGIAWCADCGRALVPSDSGKKSPSGMKYRYYACSLVLKESKTANCSVGRLSADAFEKAVVSLLGELSKHPGLIQEMISVSRSTRRQDTKELRAESDKQKLALSKVEEQLNNCADAVAKGGVDILGDALVKRAAKLREQRQQLIVRQERIRQELTASNAMVIEEKQIQQSLSRFGDVLPQLDPVEQKELVRLLIDRIDVRRAVEKGRRKLAGANLTSGSDRLMEIRLKLHSDELALGLEQRMDHKGNKVHTPHIRGLSLAAQVDFKNANLGEVVLVTPFRRTVRLDSRVRTVPQVKPKQVFKHAIIRAQKWQTLLNTGAVPHRFALAKRVGCTPGAVTKILKMINLIPEIQEYLVRIRSEHEGWHFSAKRMMQLASMTPKLQRVAFGKLQKDYETNIHISSTPVTAVSKVNIGRGPSIG